MTRSHVVVFRGKSNYKILLDYEDFVRIRETPGLFIGINGPLNRAILKKYIGQKNKKPKYQTIYLARYIVDAPKDMVVDHINGNPLDNRKENLRICNQAQNAKNKIRSSRNNGGTSKYRGVINVKKNKSRPWLATVVVNRKNVYCKSFENEIDAAKAYDLAALKFHGEFAKLNFPEKT